VHPVGFITKKFVTMHGHMNVKDFLMFLHFEYHCSPTNIKNNNAGPDFKDLDGYFKIGMSVVSRRMRWAGHVGRMGEERGVHRVLVGKPEGKRPLGRPRRRWEDNINRDLQEAGGGCGDWIERAQDRDRWRALVSTVMNFRVP
jgi:hypothetical protein